MSKQKRPQAGEWWFNYGGTDRVFIIGVMTGGSVVWESSKHGLHANTLAMFEVQFEAWHHEPRCTGWDWQPEPEPEWFDLTPHDGHVLRKEIDWFDDNGKWAPINIMAGRTVGDLKQRWAGTKFRCLLKDAPQELLKPKSATQTIVFHEVIVRHGNPTEQYTLEWLSDIPKHSNWTPTGQTETREVVR